MSNKVWMMAGVIAVAATLPSSAWADQDPATCKTCHVDQADEFAQSVHASLNCAECHRGAESYSLSADQIASFARGAAARPTFDHGPDFLGKPSRLDIPRLCGECHADIDRMNPYGLRTDQLARYKTSGHGKALYERKDQRVAICIDCHGTHDVLKAGDPRSLTHPSNVPDGCGRCHGDAALMQEYDRPAGIIAEYKQSVHGRLLLEQGDMGAPTCSTCHGNHSAVPPGYASVGAVCGRCHQHATEMFAKSAHANLEGFKGCVQCHGGGTDSLLHRIDRITKPSGMLIQRYAHLLADVPEPSGEQITRTIHPDPHRMMDRALESCLECHEEPEDDESLAGMFTLLDGIATAERYYVKTGNRLEEVAQGVLLVDRQRFAFEDAKTHLIELAPVQHTLDNETVATKVDELTALCDQVNAELDELEDGLAWRRNLLAPIWAFAICFAIALYVKYKQLKKIHVRPLGTSANAPQPEPASPSRRGFLDWFVGASSAVTGVALATPAVMYLWPAARGSGADRVEIPGAAGMQAGQSAMVQLGGKPIIVVRGRDGFKAFDAACTHLGCLVRWDTAGSVFKCPCHAAVFDADGRVVSGPPPAPMPEFAVHEIGDKVFVSPA